MPKPIVIVLVFVAGDDAEEPLSQQLLHRMREPLGLSVVAVFDRFTEMS